MIDEIRKRLEALPVWNTVDDVVAVMSLIKRGKTLKPHIAIFFAHAPTDIAELLDELDRAREAIRWVTPLVRIASNEDRSPITLRERFQWEDNPAVIAANEEEKK